MNKTSDKRVICRRITFFRKYAGYGGMDATCWTSRHLAWVTVLHGSSRLAGKPLSGCGKGFSASWESRCHHTETRFRHRQRARPARDGEYCRHATCIFMRHLYILMELRFLFSDFILSNYFTVRNVWIFIFYRHLQPLHAPYTTTQDPQPASSDVYACRFPASPLHCKS